MKLQQRLTILFALIALIPLLIVTYLGYVNQREALLKTTLQQLVTLSDLQEKRVNAMLDRYLDESKLISSRTQLRLSLQQFTATEEEGHRNKINNIIKDARDATKMIEEISILDVSGNVIGSTDEKEIGKNYETENFFSTGMKTHALFDVFKDEHNILKARLVGPLIQQGEIIGVVEVVASSAPIMSITADYTEFGKTGESILAKKNESGDALFLTPLRFDSSAALSRAIPQEKINIPIIPAISAHETILADRETVDYRGVKVFAITRFIEGVNWGLVVKVDQEEALEPIHNLAISYFSIVTLSTFLVIIMSLFITKEIANPISFLTLFAQNLQSGNFSMRTEVRGNDEIGFLSQTLNDMTEKLEELYEGLEAKVKRRTTDLQKAKKELEKKLAETERLNNVMVGRELKMIELKKEIKELKSKKKIKKHLKKQSNQKEI